MIRVVDCIPAVADCNRYQASSENAGSFSSPTKSWVSLLLRRLKHSFELEAAPFRGVAEPRKFESIQRTRRTTEDINTRRPNDDS